MKEVDITLGKLVLEGRKNKKLNLRDCASLIIKEDGTPISFQYLNDLETNRRQSPTEHIIKQISNVLDIPLELLYFYAKILPNDLNNADRTKIIVAFKKFIRTLTEKTTA